jgi:hypothetical protein
LDDFVEYGWFAELHHWSPDVVDSLPAWMDPWWAPFAEAIAEVRNKKT